MDIFISTKFKKKLVTHLSLWFHRNQGLILSNILFNNYCKLYFPRSKKAHSFKKKTDLQIFARIMNLYYQFFEKYL